LGLIPKPFAQLVSFDRRPVGNLPRRPELNYAGLKDVNLEVEVKASTGDEIILICWESSCPDDARGSPRCRK
jgi:hypothetical protein